jgi:hypothetical protein
VQLRQVMRRLSLLTAVVAVALVAPGCTPKKLPGTEIDDTSDTRAVIDVVNAYRQAVEKRNSDAIIALADPSFRDDGGSANPEDDLDYKSLFTLLPARLEKIRDVRLDVTVRKIEFDEDALKARVTYSYQLSFKMPDYTNRAQTEGDIKQMTLKRVESGWKITSGI